MANEEHDRRYFTTGMSEQELREAFYNMTIELGKRPKNPQEMNLRELFDHVAIVNDAIRAALASHPGMPPRS